MHEIQRTKSSFVGLPVSIEASAPIYAMNSVHMVYLQVSNGQIVDKNSFKVSNLSFVLSYILIGVIQNTSTP